MRTLSRMTAVLACLAVLLVALPAHAAPAPPSRSIHDVTVAQWLGSVWADLAHFVTGRPGAPAGKGPRSTAGIGAKGSRHEGSTNGGGGSCLDPNGLPCVW